MTEPKVTLVTCTMDALDTLIFTKQTRLNMSPGLFKEIQSWPYEKKMEEIEYMSNTIPSSWEFVDYTFLIENVSRAYTHQFVRNRHGSYAQQTMRVLNVENFEYITGPSIANSGDLTRNYDEGMDYINGLYKWLIDHGAKIEDARGVLPTNISTNIVAKFNMRTLSEIVSKRSSPRTQGEYRKVLQQMVDEVLEIHPWAHFFLRNRKQEAASALDKFIMACDLPDYAKTDLLKLVDQLR